MKNSTIPLNKAQIDYLRSRAMNILNALSTAEKGQTTRVDTLTAIGASLSSLNEILPKIEYGFFLETPNNNENTTTH